MAYVYYIFFEHGTLVRHGAVRQQRSSPFVNLALQMAYNIFFRFTVRRYIPDDRTDTDKWMNEHLSIFSDAPFPSFDFWAMSPPSYLGGAHISDRWMTYMKRSRLNPG